MASRRRRAARTAIAAPSTARGPKDDNRARLGAGDAQPWRVAILMLIVLFVVLSATGFLAAQFGSRALARGNWEELVYSGPLSSVISFWQRWDALWYQRIAESGYSAADGTVAYFPLYPLLARVVSFIFGGNIVLGELAVSAAAFVGAMALLWRLVRLEESDRRELGRSSLSFSPSGSGIPLALLTVLLVALFPTGFFFLAPYTESLFLLLVVATLLLARTGHAWLAGAVGLLAALTRLQGIFLILPIAYEHLRARRTLSWLRGGDGRPPSLGVLAAALPGGGLLLFTAFQRIVVGEQRSGLDVLTMWGYRLAWPWDALSASWTYITLGAPDDSFMLVEVFNATCLLGASAIAILAIRRLPLAYWLYALPSLALLFFREMYFSPLMSVGRYVLVVFPCFMVAAAWLKARPRLAIAVLVASALLELLLFQYWVRWGFVA